MQSSSQWVLITGTSRGIGSALVAEVMRHFGWNIITCSRTPSDPISDRHIPVAMDISDPETWSSLFEVLKSQRITLSGIIHNAGAMLNKPFEAHQIEEVSRIYKVNVIGPHILTSQLLPYMRSNSHVLFIGSMGGVMGSAKFPGLSAYSPSKGAISILTEVLAVELLPMNIAVNCLALGSVQTEMLEEAFPGFQSKVQPEDMARYIFSFFCYAPKYFNGSILPVSQVGI
jgi:short-subunit dehydrogenase